jgi:hypothetical protein
MPRTQAVSTAQVGAAPFFAGKNKIINGDMRFWQRGTSFSLSTGVVTYTADRFVAYVDGTVTCTASQQSFTAGTAPVSGYESQYFLRTNTTSQSGGSGTYHGQRIEDVRTFAGQTITFSLWAKADSARTYTLYLAQNFGSGGSASVNTATQNISVTTSWQRFSYTVTLGSISGKTIGTGSSLEAWIYGQANTANTLDTWGWQVEPGSVATAFQTATGTIQGELAACQRYYVLLGNTLNQPMAIGYNYSGTLAIFGIHLPVEMRTNPTISSTTGTNYYGFVRNGGTDNFNSFTLDVVGNKFINVYNSTEISGTAGNAGTLVISNSSGFLAAQAEL